MPRAERQGTPFLPVHVQELTECSMRGHASEFTYSSVYLFYFNLLHCVYQFRKCSNKKHTYYYVICVLC